MQLRITDTSTGPSWLPLREVPVVPLGSRDLPGAAKNSHLNILCF
jgi:hypothetical protein